MSTVFPQNWVIKPLRELLVSFESGSRPKGGVKGIESGVPSLGGEHLASNGGFKFEKIKFVPEAFAAKMTRGRIQHGDILVVKDGATTGKTSFVGPSFPFAEAVINEHIFSCRCRENVDPKYVFYFLFSSEGNRQILEDFRGAAQGGISQGFANIVKVPLAPFDQQKNIVAEIEKQFSRLDEAVANLKRVKANLKRYKAAILKAAVEGRLVETEAELARREGRSHETGAQLLQRILETRRSQWKGKGKYKEPAAPDTTGLPELPEGWVWVSWEMVLESTEGAFKRGPFGSALTKAIFVEKGFKVYEQYCPINDDCSFARYYITPEKFEELRVFEVQAGDYLISCSGVTLGRITRVPEKFERGIINQALLRVRINEAFINAQYYLHLFRSALFQKSIFDNSSGSAIPNVKGVKELKAMAIPLPNLAEQKRIVAEIERRLSLVHEVEAQVETNLKRAERLRQSILRKAFSGSFFAMDVNLLVAKECVR